MLSAKLIATTQPTIALRIPTAEGLIAYAARVSAPKDMQDKDDIKLLDYCKRNKHWSVFEQADATMEIECPRDISRQLLRHRSFHFQEFSQRYSDEIKFCERVVRRQDNKNRQNSINNLPDEVKDDAEGNMEWVKSSTRIAYDYMRKSNVAKECARVVLPEGLTMSKLYMKGTVRDWIHYLDVRMGNGTQKEHIDLANLIYKEVQPAFPNIFTEK